MFTEDSVVSSEIRGKLLPGRRSRINVLFTSIGRRVELLRAFHQAYSALGLEGILVGVDVDPLAPALQIVHKGYIVPTVGSEDYVSTLETICRREEIDLVLPLIDPDIAVLSVARPILEATGARVGIVSPTAVAVTADKWRYEPVLSSLGSHDPQIVASGTAQGYRHCLPAVHQAANWKRGQGRVPR